MIMCRAVSPFSSVAFMSILFANIFYFLVIPSFYLLIDNVVF
jgi:hypothetical protein